MPYAFVGILLGAVAAGEVLADAKQDPDLGAGLAGQAAALAAGLAIPPETLPPEVLVRAVIAWAQLFGMISFELFGQFVGSFEPADALFSYAADRLAAFVGLC